MLKTTKREERVYRLFVLGVTDASKLNSREERDLYKPKSGVPNHSKKQLKQQKNENWRTQ